MTWQHGAACAGYQDPDAFVPTTHTERQQLRETITARTICAMCPVTDQCLTDAVQERDYHTVRGGTVPMQRTPGRRSPRAQLPRSGDEAMFLYEGGLGPEHVAQALRIKLASVERAILRAGYNVPWPQTLTRHEQRVSA